MLRAARLGGLSRQEFWSLTMRELFQEFVIAKRNAEDAHDRDVLLAWRYVMFDRCKRLPSPEKYFARSRREDDTGQSMDQQRLALRLLGEIGGRVTTRAQREAEAKAKAARRKERRR